MSFTKERIQKFVCALFFIDFLETINNVLKEIEMSRLFLSVLVGLLFWVGCSRSVDGEATAFTKNVEQTQLLMARYPNIKPVLVKQLEQAKSAMAEAEKIQEESAKIEAMDKANDLLEVACIRVLSGIDKRIQNIQKEMTEIQAMKLSSVQRNASYRLAQNMDYTINKVEKLLQNPVSTLQEANGLATRAKTLLVDADKEINAYAKQIKKAETQEQAEIQAAKEAELAKEKAAEEAVAPIKCGHCGQMSKHDALKCSGCGAPLSKK